MSRLFIIVCTTNSLGGSVGVLFTFCLETVGFPRVICIAIIGLGFVFIAAIYVCLSTGFNHVAKAILTEIYGDQTEKIV
ncbi:MAG: hypothetical protein JOS17DRAFT_484366 [Linnemannia elongata]|nr:MAG: hypothetical protein JOS17DRAFT_484366 [Linnemannia elongata]